MRLVRGALACPVGLTFPPTRARWAAARRRFTDATLAGAASAGGAVLLVRVGAEATPVADIPGALVALIQAGSSDRRVCGHAPLRAEIAASLLARVGRLLAGREGT